jgi:hypothetical protein
MTSEPALRDGNRREFLRGTVRSVLLAGTAAAVVALTFRSRIACGRSGPCGDCVRLARCPRPAAALARTAR